MSNAQKIKGFISANVDLKGKAKIIENTFRRDLEQSYNAGLDECGTCSTRRDTMVVLSCVIDIPEYIELD